MTRKQTESISRTTCLHTRWTRSNLREDCPVVFFIFDITTFKYNTTFEFPCRVILAQLGILFNDYLKYSTNMNFSSSAFSTRSNTSPFFHTGFVPTTKIAKLCPLLQDCSKSLRISGSFLPSHRTCNTCRINMHRNNVWSMRRARTSDRHFNALRITSHSGSASI